MDMIIIADAHISENDDSGREFMEMLKVLEHTTHDVVFLGDIFDLWIAFPRYETALHRDFLQWCREQRTRRKVLFLEGNHEFFVDKKRQAAFTIYNDDIVGLQMSDILFTHGDRVNPNDKNYLRFRKLVKSRACSIFVHWVPCGKQIVHYFRSGVKKTNHNFRKFIPMAEIMAFARSVRNRGVKTIFMGHFHYAEIIQEADQTVCMVPDWLTTRKVMYFESAANTFDCRMWREIIHH